MLYAFISTQPLKENGRSHYATHTRGWNMIKLNLKFCPPAPGGVLPHRLLISRPVAIMLLWVEGSAYIPNNQKKIDLSLTQNFLQTNRSFSQQSPISVTSVMLPWLWFYLPEFYIRSRRL